MSTATGARVGYSRLIDARGESTNFPDYYGTAAMRQCGWVWVPELDAAFGSFKGKLLPLVQGPSGPSDDWTLTVVPVAHDPADTGGFATLRDIETTGGNYEGIHLDWDSRTRTMTLHVAWNAQPQALDFSGSMLAR